MRATQDTIDVRYLNLLIYGLFNPIALLGHFYRRIQPLQNVNKIFQQPMSLFEWSAFCVYNFVFVLFCFVFVFFVFFDERNYFMMESHVLHKTRTYFSRKVERIRFLLSRWWPRSRSVNWITREEIYLVVQKESW